MALSIPAILLSLFNLSAPLVHADWSKYSKIHIEAYKSTTEFQQQKIELQASSAEVTQTLKSQKLLNPSVVITSLELKISATANQALFREAELILMGNVKIKIIELNNLKKTFELWASKDLISIDLSSQILRGSDVDVMIGGQLYTGHGLRVDLNQKTILWISDVKKKKSGIKLVTPLKMKLF